MRIQDKFFFKAHRSLNAQSPYKTKQPVLKMRVRTLPLASECHCIPSTPSAVYVGTIDTNVLYDRTEEFVNKIKRIKTLAAKFLGQC